MYFASNEVIFAISDNYRWQQGGKRIAFLLSRWRCGNNRVYWSLLMDRSFVCSGGRFGKRFDVILGYETPERQLDLVQSQGLLEDSCGRKGDLNTQLINRDVTRD
jgi:hypothetical protein